VTGGSDHEGSQERRERARDEQRVRGPGSVHNVARYFSETRAVAWVLLVLTLIWGVYGYVRMPKAKDPTIEVRTAVAVCVWPGARADKIEQRITRKLEQKLAESAGVEKLESVSRTGVAIVYVTLKEGVVDRQKEWSDLQGRLDGIHDLPQGALPIQLQKDFGDTATLLLTVASPVVSDVEIDLRAAAVQRAIEAVRADPSLAAGPRATLVVSYPPEINAVAMERLGAEAQRFFDALPGTRDARFFQHPGFLGLDVATTLDDDALRARLRELADTHLRRSELHPDVWPVAIVREPRDARATRESLAATAGDRYSYRELDRYSDLIQRHLQALPVVSKVLRSGVLPEQIHLDFSQQKLASYGLDAGRLAAILAARNITAPGGAIEVDGKNVTIDPSGELTDAQQIGDVVVASNPTGTPVYLRDLVDVSRDYQSPARFLGFVSLRGDDGRFTRRRAITLAVNMRGGEQIGEFARQVDEALATVAKLLPPELIVRRTSDQPLQVKENVALFMTSLYEAIGLVVLVALIGFWDARTALLLALSIPITLAMTFGLMHVAGIDLQQISIASLIIALGLLVDVPVVASDAIKRSVGHGFGARVAAWLGPTKLAKAILFATITNIVAYLPFLTLTGDVGKFIYSLPVVLTLSLLASLVVAMTFVPLLGGAILRAPKRAEPTMAERRSRGFGRVYYRALGFAVDHRLAVFAVSLALLGGGAYASKGLKQAFFPKDLSYLAYVDVWLPEDATFSATRQKAEEATAVVTEAAEEWGRAHPRGHEARGVAAGKPETLESVTTFVGGGAPRFWFSVAPELQQPNYAQLLVQLKHKEDTAALVPFLQARLSQRVAGARVDVRQLETGKPVGIPVSIRLSGEDATELRTLADRAKAILRSTPGAERVRDDWGSDTFAVRLEVDPDRANLAGVTNLDVARSSAGAMNGAVVGQLREGDRQIDVVARLRAEERAQLGDVQDLYVSAAAGAQKVPLGQVSRVGYAFETEKIRRRNQFRTITVSAFPASGLLSSEVLDAAMPQIRALQQELPAGYKLEIGGEREEQLKSFKQMAVVAGLLVVAMYLALVVQFQSAIKPLIVFAALPYGAVAALVSLRLAGSPLGFMAILGIISLMGVIVSHVIVLFDFIEEARAHGAPMREALLDAGLVRLRPVLVTVVATVLGLFPLAAHGGPLWEPLCYAQIGGLAFATVVTLVLVPVLYTIAIRDLRWIRWETEANDAAEEPTTEELPGAPLATRST
jgi:multidrug efflux pump subunit AcrB